MVKRSEASTAAAMLDRIAARFPTVARDRIEAIVQEERERLSESRIRDYIAVLVERETIERLRKEAVAAPLPTEEADAVVPPLQRTPKNLDPMEIDRLSQVAGPLRGDIGGSLT